MRTGGGNKISEAAGKEISDRNASEGIEPRNFHVKEADSFHMLEGSRSGFDMARSHSLFRGLSPRYEVKRETRGTWEILLLSGKRRAANNPKRRGCGDRQQEVGLVRSKGVVGVMPYESRAAHLKGPAIVCRDLRKQVLSSESGNTCKRN